MKSIVIGISVVAMLACCQARCPSITQFYDEIGCKPNKHSNSDCPTSYDCSDMEDRNVGKCYFDGDSFNAKDELSKKQMEKTCQSCTCDDSLNPAAFKCADIECKLEWKLPADNCILTYNSHCCASEEFCGADRIHKLHKCHANGHTFSAGQRMFPDNEPCYKCICKEGFDNATIPVSDHCSKISCGTALRDSARLRQGCFPIYAGEQTCCPLGWRCPTDEPNTVIPEHEHENSHHHHRDEHDEMCRFAGLVLHIGDRLSSMHPEFECKCQVPPFLQCTQRL